MPRPGNIVPTGQDSPQPNGILGDIAQVTAKLRAEHNRETSTLQRAVDRLTAIAGWPGSVAVMAAAIGLWIAANSLLARLGTRPFDPPPYPLLQMTLAILAVLVTMLILATQRREEQFAGHRSQLTLQLAILNDRKISKIIELIEEIRRDSPTIADRIDTEAMSLATPTLPLAPASAAARRAFSDVLFTTTTSSAPAPARASTTRMASGP